MLHVGSCGPGPVQLAQTASQLEEAALHLFPQFVRQLLTEGAQQSRLGCSGVDRLLPQPARELHALLKIRAVQKKVGVVLILFVHSRAPSSSMCGKNLESEP